jgi:hypothetical protein
MNDTFTHSGAMKLDSKINDYWAARGYQVKTWIEEGGFISTLRNQAFFVRSDMINGLPRGYK